MSMLRVATAPVITELRSPVERPEIYYPDSDGEPMAETGFHVWQIISTAATLRERFRHRADVYVGANMFLYYRRGDPKAVVAPDVFVVFDTTNQERRSWKLWEEEGRVPVIVFEFTSEETQDKDRFFKWALYEGLGVLEYVLFDPLAEYLEPVLQGYRLVEGRYTPLPRRSLDGDFELESAVLEATLRAEGSQLALYDRATGERLLAPHQAYRRVRVEVEARRAAEARAALAEAELARVQAELARLRGRASA